MGILHLITKYFISMIDLFYLTRDYIIFKGCIVQFFSPCFFAIIDHKLAGGGYDHEQTLQRKTIRLSNYY